MRILDKNINIIKAHIPTPLGMIFYDSLELIQKDINIIGYISVIERAWMELKLDGVLSFDNRPLLYLKEFNRPFTINERIKDQRLFWNQGIANILVLVDPQNVYIYSGLAQPTNEECDDISDELALVNTLTKVEYTQQIQTLYRRLATGHYYESHQPYFNPEHTVDSWLLDHLRNLRDSLIQGSNKLNIRTAHAFIGRIFFPVFRDGPLGIHPQQEILSSDQDADKPSGRIDILISCGKGSQVYFAIEAKRLRTISPKGKSVAGNSEYINEGMMRFVTGQYAPLMESGAMLGYVFDKDIKKVRYGIDRYLKNKEKELKLTPPLELTTSKILSNKQISITNHDLHNRQFKIYHAFMAV